MSSKQRRTVAPRFRPGGRNWPLLVAFLIECGGSTKTTSEVSLATTAALRGYPGTVFDLDANMSSSRVLGYDDTALKGRPTAYDLITGNAKLSEVRVPARYRIGDGYGDDAFEVIENLWLVPASPLLSQADTWIALNDAQDWFMDLMHGYEDDDDVWWIDFPASYGKMVYSVARMLGEEDEVIPSFRADPKDLKTVPKLYEELENIRSKNRNKRSVPGRPTIHHMLLTGTPTPTYNEAPARRATTSAEQLYKDLLLPYVRYSADAKKMHEDDCPLPILLPNSYPAVDYRKVATALDFIERAG
jgi:cellulose biosynthesis protein BcsQ